MKPEQNNEKEQSASAVDAVVMGKIAQIAHFGAMIGYEDEGDAMNEIRRLTLPFLNDSTITCDICGCAPNIYVRTDKGTFCISHAPG